MFVLGGRSELGAAPSSAAIAASTGRAVRSIARIDIGSGARSVVSWEHQSVGEGPDFGGDTVEPSEDGQRAITAGGENRLVLVDLESGDRTHLVELGGPLSAGNVADAMFHPDDPGVIVFLQPYSVGLYEIATGNARCSRTERQHAVDRIGGAEHDASNGAVQRRTSSVLPPRGPRS